MVASTADPVLPTRDDLPPPSGEEYIAPSKITNGMSGPQTNGLPSSTNYTNGVMTSDDPPSATSEQVAPPPSVRKKSVAPPPKPKPKPKPSITKQPSFVTPQPPVEPVVNGNGIQRSMSTSQESIPEEEVVTSAKSRSFWRQQSFNSEQERMNSCTPSPTGSLGRRASVGSNSSLSSPSPPSTIKRQPPPAAPKPKPVIAAKKPPPPPLRRASSVTDQGFIAAQEQLAAAEQEFIRSLSPANNPPPQIPAVPSQVKNNARASPPVFHQPPPPTSLPPPLETDEAERLPPMEGSHENLLLQASASSSMSLSMSAEPSLEDVLSGTYDASTASSTTADSSGELSGAACPPPAPEDDVDIKKGFAETDDIFADIDSMIADFSSELDDMFN